MSDFIDRDLSWIKFNERVLHCSKKGNAPLFERAMYIAIASENLDQYFMVRVPKNDNDEQKKEMLQEEVRKTLTLQYACYNNLVKDLKKETNTQLVNYIELSKTELEAVQNYFKNIVQPQLVIHDLSSFNPCSTFKTGSIILALKLLAKNSNKKSEDVHFSFIELDASLERLIQTQKNIHKYILLEDLVLSNLPKILYNYTIEDSACFRITRNEELEILKNGEDDATIIKEIEAELHERENGPIIRIEYPESTSKKMLEFITKKLAEPDTEFYKICGPLDLSYMWKIQAIDDFPKLKYPPLKARYSKKMFPKAIFNTLKKEEKILLHPYDSFDAVVGMINAAADDKDVIAIKQTLYRVKKHDSPIISALENACKKGKKVSVLFEAKARFDEQNNVDWAIQLKKAGCEILFGYKDLKVHGKTLLIQRKENNKIINYVQLGTGNYYKSPYVDMSLFTSNKKIGADITSLFNNLHSPQKNDKWKLLGVGPEKLESKLIQLMHKEIKHAKAGKKAEIIAKMNGLTDKKVIKKLYEASQAGVKIILIVRGPSSLLPQKKGLSENIRVFSIVGRFLEHSRMYYFKNGGKSEYYLASADWMTRNLTRRIELMFPVLDKKNHKKIDTYFKNILQDNMQLWEENSTGDYHLVKNNKKDFSYQEYYLNNKF